MAEYDVKSIQTVTEVNLDNSAGECSVSREQEICVIDLKDTDIISRELQINQPDKERPSSIDDQNLVVKSPMVMSEMSQPFNPEQFFGPQKKENFFNDNWTSCDDYAKNDRFNQDIDLINPRRFHRNAPS